MAHSNLLHLNGKSGKSYTLDTLDLKGSLNSVPGVYIVTREEPQETNGHTHHVIYIGETKDLKQRFANHEKQGCFDQYGANSLCFLPESNEETRKAIEGDLIAQWSPTCNDD